MRTENRSSLIEVSIASLMIMLGVTGYTTLQSEYVVAATKLNLRVMALHLAQEKLIDLGYFQQLRYSKDVASYQSIATNLGGDILAGERDIVLSFELRLQTYDTQWHVENLYYVDTDFDEVADSLVKVGEPFYPVVVPRNASLKNVHITVSWLDISGDNKKLDMFGSIAPVAQSQSFQVKYRLASTLAIP